MHKALQWLSTILLCQSTLHLKHCPSQAHVPQALLCPSTLHLWHHSTLVHGALGIAMLEHYALGTTLPLDTMSWALLCSSTLHLKHHRA